MAVLDQLAIRSEFFPTAYQVVAALSGDPAAIAEHCLEGFDFYPLDAPEMALPGPDFVRQAEQLGDPPYKSVGVREEKRLEAVGPWLTYLYLRAMYDPSFALDVNVKGTLKTAPFLPGHLWGFTADGPRPADIMVIGKNPGVEEMADQRNFAGLSSRPLYHALDALQVPESEREKWYVTSVIKHPHLDPASATLAKSWQANCRPILQQELRLVRPRFILCLGKEASTAVTGNTHGVSAMAGRIVDVKIPLHRYGEEPEYHIAKAMTIYNPAYIAREPKHFDQFRIGLAHFLALAKGDRVHKKEKLDYRYIRDEDHLADVVDEVIESGHRMLAVDAEWHGEHPDEDHAYLRTLQFSHKPKFGAVVVLREQGGQPCFYNRRGRVDFGAARRQLSRLLIPHTDGSWDPMVGGHFFRSDLPWLYHLGIDLRKYYAPPKKSESCPKPWEETKHWGGWDTGLMYHSLFEDGDLDLTTLTLRFTEMDRYDILLDEWKTKYCKEHYNGKASDLQGYGECPSDILHPYAAGDVDATIRLAWTANGVNGEPGMMDHDDYGNSSREAYWIHHSASLAYLEMEMVGIGFDKARAEGLMEDFIEARDRLAGDLRQQIRWPDFNYRSTTQCKEFLFGQRLNGTKDKASGLPKRLRPVDGVTLDLTPIKTSGKRAQSWEKVMEMGEEHIYSPSTDKEVLGIFGFEHAEVRLLRNIRFADQVVKGLLKPPTVDGDGEIMLDEWGDPLYDKGLLSCIGVDGRIRSHFFQTKETGRTSSCRPNLQAISKRRESDYMRILAEKYSSPIRSIFRAAPGCVLIEADYMSAELAMIGWLADCPNMIEHVRRNCLKPSHPDYFEIHSQAAVRCFQLSCPPTKKGLELAGVPHLRTAAKNVNFGIPYGRGALSLARQCREEGAMVSIADAEALIAGYASTYPEIIDYLNECKQRSQNPGWLGGTFGSFRRFLPTSDRTLAKDQERQACNFPIQNGVADAMSLAIYYLTKARKLWGIDFKIVLQIHDAVILEAQDKYAKVIKDEILPWAMCTKVPIWPRALDGKPIAVTEPYRFGIDVTVSRSWGVDLSKEEAQKLGV